MRTFQVHVPSAVFGSVLALLVLLSMSQSTPVGPPRVEYGPNPRDMVQIREATPYVVPANKLFVLTALGSAGSASSFPSFSSLLVNGQQELLGGFFNGGAGTDLELSTVAGVPAGFTVAAGATVTVVETGSNNHNGRAWGYLADAH